MGPLFLLWQLGGSPPLAAVTSFRGQAIKQFNAKISAEIARLAVSLPLQMIPERR